MSSCSVTAWTGPAYVINYFSKLCVGLVRLDRAGVIRLRFKAGLPPWMTSPPDPTVNTFYLTIAAGGRTPVSVALDVQDQGHLFNLPALSACDVYLKRGYDPTRLGGVPEQLRGKVGPLGLIYPCLDLRTFGRLSRVWTALQLRNVMRTRVSRQAIRDVKDDLRNYLTLPTPHAFERTPDSPADPVVLFQTRVWAPGESDPADLEEVNGFRVALIRGLRAALGDRFRGGLVPTPFAAANYPDLVVRERYRRAEYARMSGRHLIGVYSRGLHHSNAFKLGEYFAAAQCIVAEPPRQQLPEPLVAGKHYLPFHSVDACVAACTQLLSDAESAARMRADNYAYYRSHVEPGAHVLGCLARIVPDLRRDQLPEVGTGE